MVVHLLLSHFRHVTIGSEISVTMYQLVVMQQSQETNCKWYNNYTCFYKHGYIRQTNRVR